MVAGSEANIPMARLGKYRHYKGNEYEVVALAKESDTFVDVVVYQGLYTRPSGVCSSSEGI